MRFGERSFIEWDFRDVFHDNIVLQRRHNTELQLQFRTRQEYGRLFQAQNIQKSEYIILEVNYTPKANLNTANHLIL